MKSDDLIVKILKSVFFKAASKKAGRIAGSSFLILKLLQETLTKVTEKGGSAGSVFTNIIEKVTLFGRMLKAYATGQYKNIPTSTILKICAAFIYFVSPIDLLPDFLPLLGLTDDLALLMWVFNSITSDLAGFEEWEKTSATEI